MSILMLTGSVVLMTINPQVVLLSFLAPILFHGLVTKKQKKVARSSTKEEYNVVVDATTK